VYDVTNPASPAELVRYEMSGGYVDSRRIGSVVYSVVHDTGATQIADLDYTLQATSYDDLQTKFNQRVADNNAKIDNTNDGYFLPWSSTTKPGGTATLSSDCQHAWVAQNAQGASFVSLNAFGPDHARKPDRTSWVPAPATCIPRRPRCTWPSTKPTKQTTQRELLLLLSAHRLLRSQVHPERH